VQSTVLDQTDVGLGDLTVLLENSPLADWARDAAGRYGISPLRALEAMGAALTETSRHHPCTTDPVVRTRATVGTGSHAYQ
jgi:hypothetical protein